MDKKTQYCQDVSPSQLDLQIQCNPIKIPVNYFVIIKKLILKLYRLAKNNEEEQQNSRTNII